MANKTIDLSNLSQPPGAKRNRKRIGRGAGSGTGNTAGKGNKGQQARSGAQSRAWFEGGQMPVQRRLPKRGFTSRNRVVTQVVNLGKLAEVDIEGDVTPEAMQSSGAVKSALRRIKVLGDGEWSKSVAVTADAFSESAKAKIEAAGGRVEVRA